MRKIFNIILISCTAISALLLAACSTTKRLGPGETLYTGVKKMDIKTSGKEELPSEMVSDLKDVINVKPNNPMPFMSPYVRTPFPIGLWVYNNWNDSATGLKGWLYRMLVRQPVLISDVRPDVRVKMMESILDKNGYFGSTANYDILYNEKNPKKARINYTLEVGEPYPIDSVIYLSQDTIPLCRAIDSLARKSEYLKPGSIFNVDSLSDARIKITNRLRNRGYYYFRPEYIEFLADSLITPHHIALKLTLAANMPKMASYAYRTRDVTTYVLRRSERNPGVPDTIQTNRGEVIVFRPAKLRKGLIPSCITFRKGRLFSVRDMDRTQERLSRLGIFGSVQIQPVPVDTTAENPLVDVYITTRFDRPMEATVEVNATSKSNSYIGPGLIFGVSNYNMFGGAEKLSVELNANYEWQTGRNSSSVFNSYEFGLTASLAFPRLLAPKFIKRRQRDLNWTTITLNADLLNRPHYFKMADFNAGIAYQWNASRNTTIQFTPFKLSYTKLIHTTHEFDSIMNLNPAVAQSFQSRFIPQLSFQYTLDKFFEREKINGITFTANFTEAGNLFDVIYKACGAKGEKKMFGTPFSQFVKGQLQLVYNRRLIRGTDHWLVTRVLIGAEHAYGNSREVPYSEQFYIGGANSIRAFTVRSLGPGSYRPPEGQRDGYFDQTGTFKFEMNAEYRFPIVSVLHGAVFLDAGNIWLLKNDPLRPGGKLQGSTFLRDLALGTGVGLRVDIGILVIRGDLGYGLHTPYSNGTPHYFNVAFKDAFAFHLAIGYPF
ncbi:MAG: BamA/TamA family outer membrane protein [Clostridium sp.]|nr:BamA/TamA family outer membrane protein [Prevotella sp.]MCM1428329.1 BamA/TamA family outer membrane protein [Clostridium sp.]MCM1474801.1 BamA/TamA family outer membrane protein [Muribaculaceae bacterium]